MTAVYPFYQCFIKMTATTPQSDLQVSISNKQILNIALPITLAMFVPQINFFTNNYFISGLGERELGTAGITGVFYLIFALIGTGLNNGLQGLIARRAGQQNVDAIGQVFGQAARIALLYAAAGMIIIYTLAPFFLSVALKSPEVTKEAIGFLQIRVIGLPFLYMFQLGNAFLIGSNNSRYMKVAFIVQALVNIVLDYGLIYGNLGLPAIGFNGAAIASVIAEITAFIIVYSLIRYKKLHVRFSLFSHFSFNKELATLYFKQSFPLVLQYLLSIVAWLQFYILIENTGERPLAISNVMRNVFSVLGIFVWPFASTCNAMVSNVIGQGNKEKVVYLIQKIMRLSLILTFSFSLPIITFPQFFMGIFNNDPGFIREAIPVTRIVASGTLLMSAATVWLNAVTGTGNTKINLVIEIVAITMYSIYIWVVIHVWHWSLSWAWLSEILYWLLIFTLSFIYIRSGKWKKKVI
ncbi:MAG: MATE family efflux transporter [Chitinophagaceae bacterium]|nr:MATE family efflux transporter [Chitinophagaceae bacterium]